MITREDKIELIRKIADEHNITAYEIGENTSVSKGTAYNLLTGSGVKPRNKTLNIILQYLEEAITGDKVSFRLTQKYRNEEELSKVEEGEMGYLKKVPFYDVEFSSGFELFREKDTKPNYYVVDTYFQDCDFIVLNTGDSMARMLKHGEAIGLKRIENWRDYINFGELYAIVTSNDLRAIKIVTKSTNPNNFKLVSMPYQENKEKYPDQEISKDMILHVFRVQASKYRF